MKLWPPTRLLEETDDQFRERVRGWFLPDKRIEIVPYQGDPFFRMEHESFSPNFILRRTFFSPTEPWTWMLIPGGRAANEQHAGHICWIVCPVKHQMVIEGQTFHIDALGRPNRDVRCWCGLLMRNWRLANWLDS